MFTGFGFFVFIHVRGLGFAVNSLEFGVRLQVGLADLQGYQAAGQGNGADVMSRGSFYCYDVSLFQRDAIGIPEIAFAGIFELYLHQFAFIGIAGDIG